MAKRIKKSEVFQIGVILAQQGVNNKIFAKLVGVNDGTVSEWVNHKTYPESKRLPKIAEVLNVNVQDLLIPTKPKVGKSLAQIESEKDSGD